MRLQYYISRIELGQAWDRYPMFSTYLVYREKVVPVGYEAVLTLF